MVGPTGGYLIGFALATWMCGALAARQWDRHVGRSLVAMTFAHVVILACGVLWLAALIGMDRAISVGLTPFIGATVAKTLLAAVTLPFAWKLAAHGRE
jgi:biotin transport system substrate-specific component